MITKYSNACLLCGTPSTDRHHLICGNGFRKLADRWNLVIPICRDCHQKIHANGTAEKLSKIAGQLLFEKEDILRGATEDEAREHFRSIFGKSYL